MTVVSWNTVLLYPAGWTSDELTYEASLRLPAGWKFGTPLPLASENGGEIKFQAVSLTRLVDSPVISGEHFRVVLLGENPLQEMDIAADSAAALDAPQDILDRYKNLADQARKLFGAQHFRDYHFLYSLSNYVAHFGLEHHESNDSRSNERALVDPAQRLLAAGLLPHEYVHSWNGKYRRPADLATPDYQKPMQDDLLWVYEGLTSYLGDLLSARSSIRTPEQYRENLARIAARLDHVPGRTWRNLQDTADGVPAIQGAPSQWESWRRTVDYYDEDVLNWLWVDTIIRQQTHGTKSMDDFCHLFHGGESGSPNAKTYTFDDVVNTLSQVAPYDWRGFWTERLTNHGPGAPLAGIEASGWKLVYDETRSDLQKAEEEHHDEGIHAAYSIGLLLNKDHVVDDTIEGMAAAKVGIGPGMKVIAANGRRFSDEVLRDALREGKTSSAPLELLVENSEYFHTYKLEISPLGPRRIEAGRAGRDHYGKIGSESNYCHVEEVVRIAGPESRGGLAYDTWFSSSKVKPSDSEAYHVLHRLEPNPHSSLTLCPDALGSLVRRALVASLRKLKSTRIHTTKTHALRDLPAAGVKLLAV